MTRTRFRQLAAVTAAATALLMVVGAYTKAIHAGLACPDWPTCYGAWFPFLQPELLAYTSYSTTQVFAEWLHRTLAAVTGLLIAATGFVAWRSPALDRPERAALVAFLLLPVQVVLGGLTVTEALNPIIVTSHLAAAVVIFAALVVAAVGERTASGGPT